MSKAIRPPRNASGGRNQSVGVPARTKYDQRATADLIGVCRSGFVERIEALVKAGADPDERGAMGIAAATGATDVCLELIRCGARPDGRPTPERLARNELTPLQLAAGADEADTCRALVLAGADVNLHDDQHGSALARACAMGNGLAVRALLSCGANVNGTNAAGESILCRALLSHETEVCRILLAHKPDLQANLAGYSPLTCALRGADRALCGERVVLVLEAGVDPYAKEVNGLTALERARDEDEPYIEVALAWIARRAAFQALAQMKCVDANAPTMGRGL